MKEEETLVGERVCEGDPLRVQKGGQAPKGISKDAMASLTMHVYLTFERKDQHEVRTDT